MNVKGGQSTYLQQLSSQFLIPYGQWIIVIGATMVAIGLTINARSSGNTNTKKPVL